MYMEFYNEKSKFKRKMAEEHWKFIEMVRHIHVLQILTNEKDFLKIVRKWGSGMACLQTYGE